MENNTDEGDDNMRCGDCPYLSIRHIQERKRRTTRPTNRGIITMEADKLECTKRERYMDITEWTSNQIKMSFNFEPRLKSECIFEKIENQDVRTYASGGKHMNQYNVSGIMRTYSEKARHARSEKDLKDVIRELKKELDLHKVTYDKP